MLRFFDDPNRFHQPRVSRFVDLCLDEVASLQPQRVAPASEMRLHGHARHHARVRIVVNLNRPARTVDRDDPAVNLRGRGERRRGGDRERHDDCDRTEAGASGRGPRTLSLDMTFALRKAAFALPFGIVTAMAAHFVRFAGAHAFGGDANEALATGAVIGSLVIAAAILHAFLISGATTVTGTIARTRLARLTPHAGIVFLLAAATYYGIEMLEGNALELGFPTIVLAALAAVVTFALRRLCALLAHVILRIAERLIVLLAARPRLVVRLARVSRPCHAEPMLAARRFGRAPPSER